MLSIGQLAVTASMTRARPSTGLKLAGTASARAISLALTAIATTLVMRELGPSQSGTYYVLITIATTAVALGHLSAVHAFVYFWSRGDDRHSLTSSAVVLGLASGCFAALAAWLFVGLLGPSRVPIGGRHGLLAVALVAVPPSIVVLYLSALLALGDRIGRANVANVCGTIVPFCLTLVLHATGRLTLSAAVAVWVCFSVLPALGLIGAFEASRRHFSRQLVLETLKVGGQYHVATVALFLLLRIDIFLLNAQVSPREVGLYALAVALVELTFLFTDSLAHVILPRQVSQPFKEAGAYTVEIMRVSIALSSVIVVGILVLGKYLVPVVFGTEFRGSTAPLVSLAPGVVAFAAIRTVGAVLVRLNRPLVVSGVTVAAMVVNIILNILLIPHYGIVGAGVASSIAYSLLAIFHTSWLLRSVSLPPTALVPNSADLTRAAAAARSAFAVRRRLASGADDEERGH